MRYKKNSKYINDSQLSCRGTSGVPNDICVYDLSTNQETHIKESEKDTNYGNAMRPDIYGDMIVWTEDHFVTSYSTSEYICLYNSTISEEYYATASQSADARYPTIYGDKIIWWRWNESTLPNVGYIIMGTINVVPVPIQKITPIITWDDPANITYGTPLSSTQLNAIATNATTGALVSGTYVYTPAAGTVLNAGTQTLHIDFTPTDTANYNTASKDVTINVINVQKTTPTIKWNNLADIAYGTALSSKQLNAKASVLGTFTYNPVAGTVLPLGVQALNVTFAPKNTAKYNTVTQTVTINVVTVPLAIFSAFPTSGKAPLPVTFTDISTGSPSTWTWKFGDGGSLKSKIPYIPVHTYTKKGKYTVSLTVKNAAGSNTVKKTSYITVK